MKHYMWYRMANSNLIEEFGHNSILVRAVRHHNEHAHLSVSTRDEYDKRTLEDFRNKGEESLLTPGQQCFATAGDPVRILRGAPGTGKTLGLWYVVEKTDSHQQVLYITWSSRLAERAQEYFATFAPNNLVITRYFTQFLGEICQYDIKNPFFREIKKEFFDDIMWRIRDQLGPWATREYALYTELRSFLLGQAIPSLDDGSVARLTNHKYFELRGYDNKAGIGPDAAKAFLRIVEAIESREKLEVLFPELAAATRAIKILRDNALPSGFAKFDQIIIDEIQDLTLLESAVIMELRKAIERQRNQAPRLLVAGDDSQTVRPSGFQWTRLKEQLDNPKEFFLEESLRCPPRIKAVIGRARKYYQKIDKEARPSDTEAEDVTLAVD